MVFSVIFLGKKSALGRIFTKKKSAPKELIYVKTSHPIFLVCFQGPLTSTPAHPMAKKFFSVQETPVLLTTSGNCDVNL